MINDIKDFNLEMDFKKLLRETFIMACSIARDTAIEILTHVDEQIRENVNSKRY